MYGSRSNAQLNASYKPDEVGLLHLLLFVFRKLEWDEIQRPPPHQALLAPLLGKL